MCRSHKGPCRGLRVESLERRRLYAGDLAASIPQATVQDEAPALVAAPTQASARESVQASLDVNGDSRVSATDALMVVNRLSLTLGSDVATQSEQAEADPRDVNRDGVVSAADALAIINHMSQQPAADASEGPITPQLELLNFDAILPPPCSCGGIGCPACIGPAIETDATEVTDFSDADDSDADSDNEIGEGSPD